MENIKAPKSVEAQLSKEERVIGKISSGKADYYATDKRLLRFKSEADYHVLEYPQVSITFMKYGMGWKLFRVFAVLFGLLSFGLGVLGFIGPTTHNGTTTMHWGAPFGVSLLLWVIGLGCIAMGLLLMYAYYQIKAPGIEGKELKRWRIQRHRWGSANADRFAKIVEERSGSSTAD